MKYIFVAGAPGSKWSSVVKNIYYSPSIDRSDYRDEWTYYHDASGQRELMHLGAYWDPGMACDLPEDVSTLTRQQLEEKFNEPFNKDSTGIRIIKSHIFSYENNIRYLREQFVDCAIVLVHRSDDACLGWWVKCGHFDITYPSYTQHYKDLREMSKIITEQNSGILKSIANYTSTTVNNNLELCKVLGLAPPAEYQQTYAQNDIKVQVIWHKATGK
jgi:hypothetical protein